jgi:hypothetical protein
MFSKWPGRRRLAQGEGRAVTQDPAGEEEIRADRNNQHQR